MPSLLRSAAAIGAGLAASAITAVAGGFAAFAVGFLAGLSMKGFAGLGAALIVWVVAIQVVTPSVGAYVASRFAPNLPWLHGLSVLPILWVVFSRMSVHSEVPLFDTNWWWRLFASAACAFGTWRGSERRFDEYIRSLEARDAGEM